MHVFQSTLTKQRTASSLLYTINNIYNKLALWVELYKLNLSTKHTHLVNQCKARWMKDVQAVCLYIIICMIHLNWNIKQPQIDFNQKSKIKKSHLGLTGKLVSVGKMVLYLIYLGWLKPWWCKARFNSWASTIPYDMSEAIQCYELCRLLDDKKLLYYSNDMKI